MEAAELEPSLFFLLKAELNGCLTGAGRTSIISKLYNEAVMNLLDSSFAALADPTRRAILARLALGEATVLELAKPFRMTQPAVSRHLKVLEVAGLIEQRVDGTRRPRRLAKPALDNIDQYLNTLRRALAANYDRLDQVLAEMNQSSDSAPKQRKSGGSK